MKDEGGRPYKPIDWEKADQLLEAGCTGMEIAAYFNMHHQTFYDRTAAEKNMGFTAYQAQKKSRGDSLLRAKQFQTAMQGDKSMMIWLGKQRLDQKEQQEVKQDISVKIIDFSNATCYHGTKVKGTTKTNERDKIQ